MKLSQILLKRIVILHFLWFFTSASFEQWHAYTNRRARLECNHRLGRADIITWQKNNTQIVYKISNTTNVSEGFDLEEEPGKVYLVIKNVKKDHSANYSCTVFHRSQENDYKTIRGFLQVTSLSHPLRASLSALLFGCLLQAALLAF